MARRGALTFERGENGVASGGPRPNSGRRPNWLKDLCDDMLFKHYLPEQMGDIAAGKAIAIRYKAKDGKDRVLVRVPTLADMKAATEWLADRSHGKPRQSVDVTVDMTVNLISAIRTARMQRGLKE